MRILDDIDDHPVGRIWFYLTEDEVSTLLRVLQERVGVSDPEWHIHIDDSLGSDVAITVAVYDLANLPTDPKMSAFLRDGSWDLQAKAMGDESRPTSMQRVGLLQEVADDQGQGEIR